LNSIELRCVARAPVTMISSSPAVWAGASTASCAITGAAITAAEASNAPRTITIDRDFISNLPWAPA